jgi:pimeloyl-ACP methyl ester carboxylesterase
MLDGVTRGTTAPHRSVAESSLKAGSRNAAQRAAGSVPPPTIDITHPVDAPTGLGALIAWFERREAKHLRRDGFVPHDITVNDAGAATHVRLWDAPGHGPLPPVVLIHGLGGDSVSYAALLRRLQQQCQRVITVDLPGHGDSAPVGMHQGPPPSQPYAAVERAFHRVRQALDIHLAGLPRYAFVAHSLGGYFASRYALEGRHRAGVVAMVLAASDGGHFAPDVLAATRDMMRASEPGKSCAPLCKAVWPGQPLRAMLMAPFMKAVFSRPSLRYVVESDLVQPELTPAQLQALPPTCLLWGGAETMQLPEHLLYFRANLPPGSVVVEPPGVGHGGIIDAPLSLCAPLFDFLGRFK